MNKVNLLTDDHGIVAVSLNHISLDGVQAVSYRREKDRLPVVTIELTAELYHTDPEDIQAAESAARKRLETARAKAGIDLTALYNQSTEGRNE